MREIEFRGRISEGIENAGSWVYWGIEGTDLIDVIDKDTVGQFTGLHDKNGKEIWEGDILATSNSNPEYDIWDKDCYGYTVVKWSNYHCAFRATNWIWFHDTSTVYGLPFIEVIGNIYENPELLEVKDER